MEAREEEEKDGLMSNANVGQAHPHSRALTLRDASLDVSHESNNHGLHASYLPARNTADHTVSISPHRVQDL